MLPGKNYSVDDILLILRRRYWFVILPFALVGAGAAWYTRGLPNVYTADTVIMVQPQRVPENYVQSTVTTRIEDRLPTLRTTILSRTRLERIITEFDLYPNVRRGGPMEVAVAMMTRSIDIETATGNSFRVRYRGDDPVKVMRVTDSLAALFINENLRDRRLQAENTSQFLDSQLIEARMKLEDHERRLAAWKMTHAGELPTQYEANLQQVQNTQMALRDLRTSSNQERTRRLELERQRANLQNPNLIPDVVVSSQTGGGVPAVGSLAQQLADAEAQVSSLEQRGYKAGHPALDSAARRVRDLKSRLDAQLAVPASPGPRPGTSVAENTRLKLIDDLSNQIAQIDKQLARDSEEEKRLMAVAADAQRRADSIPTRESEYISLTRDYETLRTTYTSLLANKNQAQIAANLETRQVGEQFKLVDPAQLPARPISPNRPRDIAMGLGGGLLIGVLLLVFLEQRDRSFATDREVTAILDLPVLAVVPVMKSDADIRRAVWSRLFVSVGLGGVVAWCLVFVAYVAVGQ